MQVIGGLLVVLATLTPNFSIARSATNEAANPPGTNPSQRTASRLMLAMKASSYNPLVLTPIAATVTNATDSGPGSLRQAINDAISGDTITFSLPTGSVINLTSGELLINKNLTISGPGAGDLRIQRSTATGTAQFRIFNIPPGNFNVSITGLTISNGATDLGGTVRNNSNGTVNLSSLVISGSSASSLGGGIYNNNAGTLNVFNSTISGNTASAGCCGGGISTLGGTLNIRSSTIVNNSSPSGGGIYGQSSVISIINSTFTGNSSNNGGGLNVQLANVSITNATISGNAAPSGGGIFIYSSPVGVRNTIIAGNSGSNGPDVVTAADSSQLTSQGFNLIGNNSGASISVQSTDQIGTTASPIDPRIGTLVDNGGPTYTRAPLVGSPAIDKGGAAANITTDQRGLPRPIDDPALSNVTGGDGSDIGAFELQSSESPATPASDSITYSYDSLNRLLAASYADGRSLSYSYDPAGNRTALQISGISIAVNTTAGSDVTSGANGIRARFTNVTGGGVTSIALLSPTSVGSLPNGFQLFGDSSAFNISTTAATQGPIGVCFNGYFNTDSLTFARLRILHNENGVWVNRTNSSDFASRTVCSTVSSIGQFALVLLGPPTALIDSTSNRAAALNSVTVLRDPVTIIDTYNFSVDQRARLAFFVQSVDLLPAENLSLVTAQARDAQNVLYTLPVESVVKVPNMDWLSQVVIKLPDALIGKGDVQVTLTVRGIESQQVTVRVQ